MNKLFQNVVLNFSQFALIFQRILYIGPELCVYFNYISGYRVLALVVNVVRDIKLMLGNKRLMEIYHYFSFF